MAFCSIDSWQEAAPDASPTSRPCAAHVRQGLGTACFVSLARPAACAQEKVAVATKSTNCPGRPETARLLHLGLSQDYLNAESLLDGPRRREMADLENQKFHGVSAEQVALLLSFS